MQLAEVGLVGLDAPVQRYIPWFRAADPRASGQITIRHLLNQTSGLGEAAGNLGALAAGTQPLEAAVRALATARLTRPPGAAFEYSNLNYTTLGPVVEIAAGQPLGRYLQAHIFEPLQMRHTYTSAGDARRDGLACGYRYWFGFPAAFGAPALGTLPDGGIISTAEDMSHYLAMYQNGGRYHGKVVLSPAGIAQMMQPGPREKRAQSLAPATAWAGSPAPGAGSRRPTISATGATRTAAWRWCPTGTGASWCCSTSACTAAPFPGCWRSSRA